jgi:diacylglycerol kinase (ATP)
MKRPLYLIDRIRSFKCAFQGIWVMIESQQNAWIHALATLAVTAAGLYFHISLTEWCAAILAIVVVWTAEALNTAFEFLADATKPEFHPLIRKAKDVAAGAVLISAIGAAAIAMIVFGPHILALFGR